jgi:hypothetical protein
VACLAGGGGLAGACLAGGGVLPVCFKIGVDAIEELWREHSDQWAFRSVPQPGHWHRVPADGEAQNRDDEDVDSKPRFLRFLWAESQPRGFVRCGYELESEGAGSQVAFEDLCPECDRLLPDGAFQCPACLDGL